jgi:hypothetical protein
MFDFSMLGKHHCTHAILGTFVNFYFGDGHQIAHDVLVTGLHSHVQGSEAELWS